MKDKISLAGDLGSGKSTVSKILIDRLGAEYYHTGAIVREVAERHGMSVVELNHYMETHPEIDREIDDGLIALSGVDKLLVIDSRMAWHFTKGTFKIYLSTDIETSAARIMRANRKGEHAMTLEQTVDDTRARRISEQKRYFGFYGVDIKDLTNYDLIVDTTYATPEEIAEVIIASFERWQADKTFRAAFISPERLHYVDDEQQSEDVELYSGMINSGSEPEVVVVESAGEFYVKSGTAATLAYALDMRTFVKARLDKYDGEAERATYVRMKNSL